MITCFSWYFNSHAHVERDAHFCLTEYRTCISTHTLTWSVTLVLGVKNAATDDFNSHAHVERDVDLGTKNWLMYNFNSHAHVERDMVDMAVMERKMNFNSHAHVERDHWQSMDCTAISISTHTLTWSVTLTFISGRISKAFQLTRSRGA